MSLLCCNLHFSITNGWRTPYVIMHPSLASCLLAGFFPLSHISSLYSFPHLWHSLSFTAGPAAGWHKRILFLIRRTYLMHLHTHKLENTSMNKGLIRKCYSERLWSTVFQASHKADSGIWQPGWTMRRMDSVHHTKQEYSRNTKRHSNHEDCDHSCTLEEGFPLFKRRVSPCSLLKTTFGGPLWEKCACFRLPLGKTSVSEAMEGWSQEGKKGGPRNSGLAKIS